MTYVNEDVTRRAYGLPSLAEERLADLLEPLVWAALAIGGMRKQELRLARVVDVSLAHGAIQVPSVKQPNHSRWVPLATHAAAGIDALITLRNLGPADRLFVREYPVRHLRFFGAGQLYKACGDPGLIALIFGHRAPLTIKRIVPVTLAELRRAMVARFEEAHR